MIGEQPPINIDDLLADEAVIADTAIKKGMAPIHSEVDAQEKIQTFVESILDRGSFLLTSEKGKDYEYRRDGNKLLRQKKQNGPWEDATEEAFKRKNKGWKLTIAPTTGDAASAEDPIQQAGEPATVSSEVSSSTQTEKLAKPEALAEFVAVLDGIRTEVMDRINAIRTPVDYVSFRNEMVITTGTGKDKKPTPYRFFHIGIIKDQLQREQLTDDEITLIKTSKVELEDATQKKLYELVHADLSVQFNREKAKIDAVEDEKALDVLVEKLQITPTVSDALLDQIQGREAKIDQEIVDTEYRICKSSLNGAVQIKREELLKPFLEIETAIFSVLAEKDRLAKELLKSSSADEAQKKAQEERYKKFFGYLKILERETNTAFRRNIDELRVLLKQANEAVFKLEEPKKKTKDGAGEKELTNEELFAILAEALKSKRRPFGKDHTGKELIIEENGISDTEIRYRYGADKTETTPEDVKFLLDMLREEYGWEPRVLAKRRVVLEAKEAERRVALEIEEAEKIREELATVVSEKKAFFQEESAKLSASPEVLSQNIAYLDSIVVRAQKAFDAGDIEYLRGVLKIANEAVFKQEEPKKKKATDSKPVVPVVKDKVANKKNTLRGVAIRDLTAHSIFDGNPFEGLNDSEEERGQTEEEKKYESLYQMLGKDPLRISLEEERMKGVIAAGLQKFEEKLKEKLEIKDVNNLVELVYEHREALASSLLDSILIRLGQFPFDQAEKEFFARRFIETYFEDHKI